jgi:hypothetical protein
MKKGYLSEYFEGVAAKRLSAVEADTTRSHQHEFQAISKMLAFMGRPPEKTRISARFMYLTDEDSEPIIEDAFLTLYDSRKDQPHRSAEFRFYFPTTQVSLKAAEGDLLVIAKRRDAGLLVIIAENNSSIAAQIKWLFGFADLALPRFSVKSELENEQDRIAFASRLILENIGIEVEATEDSFLDSMLEKFDGRFPKTREFSAFARDTLDKLHPKDDPDAVLMAWMEREEILFRTLERHLISDRLTKGFAEPDKKTVDVDGFVAFSLSVHNRRKSRVGFALENHLEFLFDQCGILYDRGKYTENRSKPDFIFPSIEAYRNQDFAPFKLTMLGVKSTCKDRWRQVLAEARRIEQKYLLTIEASISRNQTDEMAAWNVQLVLPKSIHETYTLQQQSWLMSISEFTSLILQKQNIV